MTLDSDHTFFRRYVPLGLRFSAVFMIAVIVTSSPSSAEPLRLGVVGIPESYYDSISRISGAWSQRLKDYYGRDFELIIEPGCSEAELHEAGNLLLDENVIGVTGFFCGRDTIDWYKGTSLPIIDAPISYEIWKESESVKFALDALHPSSTLIIQGENAQSVPSVWARFYEQLEAGSGVNFEVVNSEQKPDLENYDLVYLEGVSDKDAEHVETLLGQFDHVNVALFLENSIRNSGAWKVIGCRDQTFYFSEAAHPASVSGEVTEVKAPSSTASEEFPDLWSVGLALDVIADAAAYEGSYDVGEQRRRLKSSLPDIDSFEASKAVLDVISVYIREREGNVISYKGQYDCPLGDPYCDPFENWEPLVQFKEWLDPDSEYCQKYRN